MFENKSSHECEVPGFHGSEDSSRDLLRFDAV